MVKECAFGRLKATFGALKREMDINLLHLPHVIYACFILHNHCELQKEKVGEDVVAASIAYDKKYQPQIQRNRQNSFVVENIMYLHYDF